MSAVDQALKGIAQGTTYILDGGDAPLNLRPITFNDKVYRFFHRAAANEQDKKVASALARALVAQPANDQLLKASTNFANRHVSYKGTEYENLNNAIYAIKCSERTSLKVNELVNNDGSAKGPLLKFLHTNKLHNVLPHDLLSQTAVIFDKEKNSYIRATEGKDFLASADDIDLILNRYPEEFKKENYANDLENLIEDQKQGAEYSYEEYRTDLKKFEIARAAQDLIKLKNHLNGSKPLSDEERDTLLSRLNAHNFRYTKVADLMKEQKGSLLKTKQAYLARGIQKQDVSEWTTFEAAYREPSYISQEDDEQDVSAKYIIRIVARPPKYSFEKTWSSFFTSFLPNLPKISGHGHAWLEIVEPEKDDQGKYTGISKVYSAGYFMRGKIFTPDHQTYVPIPKKYVKEDATIIEKDHFTIAKRYVEAVQHLILNDRKISSLNGHENEYTAEDIREISRLYYRMIGANTCLGFANEMKNAVTGQENDYRSSLRKKICPRSWFDGLDRLHNTARWTFFTKRAISLIAWINRGQLPHFTKNFSEKGAERPMRMKEKPKTR